jgi:hypothetical protein
VFTLGFFLSAGFCFCHHSKTTKPQVWEVKVKSCSVLLAVLLLSMSADATEQDLLITTDVVLKAGASQRQTFRIQKPAATAQLVKLGFKPVKALSVECTLRLYSASADLLGSYPCHQQQTYQLNIPQQQSYRAEIEVNNLNFSSPSSSFSVIHRFNFVSPAP